MLTPLRPPPRRPLRDLVNWGYAVGGGAQCIHRPWHHMMEGKGSVVPIENSLQQHKSHRSGPASTNEKARQIVMLPDNYKMTYTHTSIAREPAPKHDLSHVWDSLQLFCQVRLVDAFWGFCHQSRYRSCHWRLRCVQHKDAEQKRARWVSVIPPADTVLRHTKVEGLQPDTQRSNCNASRVADSRVHCTNVSVSTALAHERIT